MQVSENSSRGHASKRALKSIDQVMSNPLLQIHLVFPHKTRMEGRSVFHKTTNIKAGFVRTL